MIKFLLVSPSRCGSQLLVSGIYGDGKTGLDKNCTMVNEIFNHQAYIKQTGVKRFKKPLQYINFFLNKAKTKSSGAKILIGPMFRENIIDNILLCPKFKIIFMYRENLLESYISGRVAKFKKQYMAPPAKYNPLTEKLVLDHSMEQIGQRLQARYDQVKHCLDLIGSNKDLKSRSVIVKYTDIYKNEAIQLDQINKIRAFVGLKPLKKMTPWYVKQNNNKTYSHIVNRKELEEKFGEKFGFLGSSETPLIWSQ